MGTFYMLLAGAAALLAMCAALFHLSIIWQGIIFIVATFLFYMYLIPILRKMVLFQNEELQLPTMQSLVGQIGIVVKEIAPVSGGQVKVGNDIYSAIADDAISEGSQVKVVEVKVTKLYVRKEGM
jgi:inner membrane protein